MLNELSPELVGKVNKARLSKPAKSPAARATLTRAVRKAWLKSKVGVVKEDLGGGPGSPTTGGIANVAGPATSTSDVHWSKRQPNLGPKGPKKKYGQPMVFSAVMRRKMTGEQTVFYKALGKRVKAVSRTSAMGGGSDGSGGNGGGGGGNGSESVQREHIVKTDGGYRLVSKKTGKNLGTYPSRAGAERRERQVQYFKHKG
jgi:hypothetical protein